VGQGARHFISPNRHLISGILEKGLGKPVKPCEKAAKALFCVSTANRFGEGIERRNEF